MIKINEKPNKNSLIQTSNKTKIYSLHKGQHSPGGL